MEKLSQGINSYTVSNRVKQAKAKLKLKLAIKRINTDTSKQMLKIVFYFVIKEGKL